VEHIISFFRGDNPPIKKPEHRKRLGSETSVLLPLIFDPEGRGDMFPPKRVSLYGPHGSISKKLATFVTTAERTCGAVQTQC
jgi:hypothetical protein